MLNFSLRNSAFTKIVCMYTCTWVVYLYACLCGCTGVCVKPVVQSLLPSSVALYYLLTRVINGLSAHRWAIPADQLSLLTPNTRAAVGHLHAWLFT